MSPCYAQGPGTTSAVPRLTRFFQAKWVVVPEGVADGCDRTIWVLQTWEKKLMALEVWKSSICLSADFGAESRYQVTLLLLARGRFQRAHGGHGKHSE